MSRRQAGEGKDSFFYIVPVSTFIMLYGMCIYLRSVPLRTLTVKFPKRSLFVVYNKVIYYC